MNLMIKPSRRLCGLLVFSLAALFVGSTSDVNAQQYCLYNGDRIGCSVVGVGGERMTIAWSDGVKQSYTLVSVSKEYDHMRGRYHVAYEYMDRYGGSWTHYCNLARNWCYLDHSSNGNSMKFIYN